MHGGLGGPSGSLNRRSFAKRFNLRGWSLAGGGKVFGLGAEWSRGPVGRSGEERAKSLPEAVGESVSCQRTTAARVPDYAGLVLEHTIHAGRWPA